VNKQPDVTVSVYVKRFLKILLGLMGIGLSVLFLMLFWESQRADPDFDATVRNPAYRDSHPHVLFDEAHNNSHTASGRYSPFVNLLTHDGYVFARNRNNFREDSLDGHEILIIVNAKGIEHKNDPAFTAQECAAVADWVRNGGSLLLIADHFPFGSANQILADAFGIQMSKGETSDVMHYASAMSRDQSQLVFSRKDHLLGNHPILEGRNQDERIERVMTFTGQSLKGPPSSTPLLILSDTAKDILPVSIEFQKTFFGTNMRTTFGEPVPAKGSCQGMAIEFGKGRVVVLGEAAMLTSQITRGQRFGMSTGGSDNRQFALNIMHWLSRLL
jgi:hypothetical protein